jgi:hypothetical protein
MLAMDFIETVTLTGARQYILAAIDHTSRRVRILGTTAHPRHSWVTHSWVTQAVRNLLMDLEDAASPSYGGDTAVMVTTCNSDHRQQRWTKGETA